MEQSEGGDEQDGGAKRKRAAADENVEAVELHPAKKQAQSDPAGGTSDLAGDPFEDSVRAAFHFLDRGNGKLAVSPAARGAGARAGEPSPPLRGYITAADLQTLLYVSLSLAASLFSEASTERQREHCGSVTSKHGSRIPTVGLCSLDRLKCCIDLHIS